MGLVLYVFDVLIFVLNRQSFNNSFYILAGHCAVGDMANLLVVIVYVVPLSWANDFVVVGERAAQLLANLDSVIFNTIFILLGPVALNRLMAILGEQIRSTARFFPGVLHPSVRATGLVRLFTEAKWVRLIGLASWAYALGISVALRYVAACRKLFDPQTMTF